MILFDIHGCSLIHVVICANDQLFVECSHDNGHTKHDIEG